MQWVAIGPPSGVYVASLAMEPAMPMYVAAWVPHDLSGALCKKQSSGSGNNLIVMVELARPKLAKQQGIH